MKKVILFGSGRIGYGAFMFFGDDIVHCFVDNNPLKVGKTFCEKKIISFNELLEIYNEQDYEVIISCAAYESISAQLIKAGIKSFKKFERPIVYDYITSVKKCMPKELITSGTLDVVAKYLYAKDILSVIKDTPNKSLYARMMLSSHGCTEYTPEKTKEGLEEFFNAFERLCKNMQEEDFKEQHHITMAKNKCLHDGAHRLAIALALNQDVYVGTSGEYVPYYYTFDWFVKNRFSFEDRVRILRGFADLYDECGIFVLFAPMQEQWGYIEAQIEKEYKIVGAVDIDLSHNFIAFEILIREIYGDYSEGGFIEDKISFLKMAPLITRIVLVSNELKNLEKDDFYQSITDFKLHIREILDYELKKDSFCLFHASSCYNEFIHLKNVLLSVNNLKSIEGRISPVYRHEFLRRVLFVREYCKENDIPIEKICIIGSSTMEVLGITKARDLDFIGASDVCPKLEDLIVGVADSFVEIAKDIGVSTMNSFTTEDGKIIENDLLIDNDCYHFVFYGCKFVNLEMVKTKKRMSALDKDIKHIRLIELYEDFTKSFDDKKALKEQFELEIKRRAERQAAEQVIFQ